MATTGAYEFRLSPAADPRGVVADENAIGRGEWAWIDRTQEFEGIRGRPESWRWLALYLRCPDCGLLATAWRSFGDPGHGHTIDPDGTLHPSVGCPPVEGRENCGFHTEPTRLLGFVDQRNAS